MLAIIRFAFATLVLLAAAFTARAETTDCTEITYPTYIYTPGIYCFKRSFSIAGGGIVVVADDVVIDLNGHVLENTEGPATSATGIRSENQKNITVRNGTIRGFRTGVMLGGTELSSGHLVENMLIDRNLTTGIAVSGREGVVRRNRVIRTGGSSVGPHAFGINVGGNGIRVLDNEVTATLEGAGGQAWGIYAYQIKGGAVERNLVSNAAFGPSASTGIFVTTATQGLALVGNRVANMRTGISAGAALYMDNTVGGATTPFSGGVPAGSTNYSFY
jgi:hypothetical protein